MISSGIQGLILWILLQQHRSFAFVFDKNADSYDENL